MENKVTMKYYKMKESVRIFGSQFVENTKKYRLKMEIDGEIMELNDYYYNETIKINI